MGDASLTARSTRKPNVGVVSSLQVGKMQGCGKQLQIKHLFLYSFKTESDFHSSVSIEADLEDEESTSSCASCRVLLPASAEPALNLSFCIPSRYQEIFGGEKAR